MLEFIISIKKELILLSFDSMTKVLRHPLFISLYFICCVSAFFYWDKPIALYIHTKNMNDFKVFLEIATHLGSNKIYLVGLILLALIFRFVTQNRLWEMRTWFLWLCIFIPNLICTGLKIILGRARPELLFEQGLYGFYGFHDIRPYWSFPSGHTTTAMSLVFGLSILFPRYWLAFFTTGLMIVSTRLMLTQHYLSDLMVATYLAFIEVYFLFYLLKKYQFGQKQGVFNQQ